MEKAKYNRKNKGRALGLAPWYSYEQEEFVIWLDLWIFGESDLRSKHFHLHSSGLIHDLDLPKHNNTLFWAKNVWPKQGCGGGGARGGDLDSSVTCENHLLVLIYTIWENKPMFQLRLSWYVIKAWIFQQPSSWAAKMKSIEEEGKRNIRTLQFETMILVPAPLILEITAI